MTTTTKMPAEVLNAWKRIVRADGYRAHARAERLFPILAARYGSRMPTCWCGCDEPATRWESDSGDFAAPGCVDYAIDDDGQPVCACHPSVVDCGTWTGGGMHGVGGSGWVSDLRVGAVATETAPATETVWTWRTDAGSGTFRAATAEQVLRHLVADDWWPADRQQERAAIRDGAWIRIWGPEGDMDCAAIARGEV